jgi:hypothetical protein
MGGNLEMAEVVIRMAHVSDGAAIEVDQPLLKPPLFELRPSAGSV